MQARETAQVEHPVCSNPHPHHVPLNHNHHFPASQLMNPIPNPLYHFEMTKQLGEFNLRSQMTSCFSNNSTCNEAEEQQIRLMNERKQRRMNSNRESARRSRMRKQKQLDELSSQVACLRNENNQLMNKLNSISEKRDKALHENANLKGEASCLRRMIADMQLGSPYCSMKDHPCTALLEEN